MVRCLDSDLMIALLRGEPDALSYVQKLEADGDRIFTTLFNAQELWEGAFLRSEREVVAVDNLLSRLTLLFPTEESARWYGATSAALSKKGKTIPPADLMIASVAVQHGVPIVTRNDAHFARITGLTVIPW